MDVGQVREGDLVVLTPEGDINAPQDCSAIERAISAAIGAGARSVVIDCAKASQVSAAAIRLLLLSQKRLTVQRGSLVLCGLSAATRKAFAISGFDRDFTIAATRQEATGIAAAVADSRKRAPGAAKSAPDAKAPSPAKAAPEARSAPEARPGPRVPAAPAAAPSPSAAPAAAPVATPEAATPPASPLADLVARTLAAGLPASATIPPPPSPPPAGLASLAEAVARALAS